MSPMRAERDRALEREFDVLMATRGVTVPDEWRAGAIACYLELAHMTSLLRRPSAAACEPANVFRMSTILSPRDP